MPEIVLRRTRHGLVYQRAGSMIDDGDVCAVLCAAAVVNFVHEPCSGGSFGFGFWSLLDC